jgi:tetratricopeptide (TPR) repeat protein
MESGGTPLWPILSTYRGEANFNIRKYEEALADFDRAIELDPAGAAAFYGRGLVLERQGHYQEAAAALTAALERNSTLTAATQGLDRVNKRLSRH